MLKTAKRIVLIAMLTQIIALVVLLGIIVYSIKAKEQKDIKSYKAQEISQTKHDLKNYVDIVYSIIDANYQKMNNPKALQRTYEKRLSSIIDVTESIIKDKMALVAEGKLTLKEAQRQAKNEIKKFRYGGGSGYIWINDTTYPYPRMIMHPIKPELDGQILDDPKFNCALGKGQNLFVAFLEVCNKNGEGFVDYIWPKPTKEGKLIDRPKFSYVRLIKKWNWIIGTGVYMDDVVLDTISENKAIIKNIRYDNGVGYFFVLDAILPDPKVIMHPVKPELINTFSSENPQYKAVGSDKHLYVIFVELCKKYGEGFVEYQWENPTKKGEMKEVPKLSFVKLYKPLNWVIGTGVSLTDVGDKVLARLVSMNKEVKEILVRIIFSFLIIIILANLILIKLIKRSHLGELQVKKDEKEGVERFDEDEVIDDDEFEGDTKEVSRLLKEISHLMSAYNNAIEASQIKTFHEDVEKIYGEIKQLVEQNNMAFHELKETLDTLKKTDLATKLNDKQHQEILEKLKNLSKK